MVHEETPRDAGRAGTDDAVDGGTGDIGLFGADVSFMDAAMGRLGRNLGFSDFGSDGIVFNASLVASSCCDGGNSPTMNWALGAIGVLIASGIVAVAGRDCFTGPGSNRGLGGTAGADAIIVSRSAVTDGD